MDVVLLVARLVLAAVFAVAGAAKLADRHGSRHAAVDFGVPARAAGAVAILLPLLELGIASALLPAAAAVWAALAAVGLLLAFSLAIGINLRRGRAPDCHCFGQLHSEPAGWRTLARNAALAGAAIFVVAGGWSDPGLSGVAWIGRLDTGGALAVGAVGAVAVVAAGAAWLLRRLRKRIDDLEVRLAQRGHDEPVFGLPLGARAPDFVLPDVAGEEVALSDLRALGKPVLLIFTDPGCGPCQGLLPEIARWQEEYDDLATFVLISSGSPLDVRAQAEEHDLEFVLMDEERLVYRSYEGAGMPSTVLVFVDGTIGTPLAAGPKRVSHLVERFLGRLAGDQGQGLALGEPIPDVTFRSIDGSRVRISDFRSAETLFLFWSTTCPHCGAIREEVGEWEAAPVPGAPRLVIIASGDADRIREEGFASTVLLDSKRGAADALGRRGTPTAVLVDADGRVAWPLAVGGRSVLKLLRSRGSLGTRA